MMTDPYFDVTELLDLSSDSLVITEAMPLNSTTPELNDQRSPAGYPQNRDIHHDNASSSSRLTQVIYNRPGADGKDNWVELTLLPVDNDTDAGSTLEDAERNGLTRELIGKLLQETVE